MDKLILWTTSAQEFLHVHLLGVAVFSFVLYFVVGIFVYHHVYVNDTRNYSINNYGSSSRRDHARDCAVFWIVGFVWTLVKWSIIAVTLPFIAMANALSKIASTIYGDPKPMDPNNYPGGSSIHLRTFGKDYIEPTKNQNTD